MLYAAGRRRNRSFQRLPTAQYAGPGSVRRARRWPGAGWATAPGPQNKGPQNFSDPKSNTPLLNLQLTNRRSEPFNFPPPTAVRELAATSDPIDCHYCRRRAPSTWLLSWSSNNLGVSQSQNSSTPLALPLAAWPMSRCSTPARLQECDFISPCGITILAKPVSRQAQLPTWDESFPELNIVILTIPNRLVLNNTVNSCIWTCILQLGWIKLFKSFLRSTMKMGWWQ